MDSEQRRKRKRVGRPSTVFSVKFFVLCFFFFLILWSFLSTRRFRFILSPASFRPILGVSFLSSSSSFSSAVNSIHDSPAGNLLPLRVEGRVVFPDHLLLLVSNGIGQSENLDCVYYKFMNESGDKVLSFADNTTRPALSADEYDGVQAVVRCPLPPLNYSAAVNLKRQGDAADNNWVNQTVPSWHSVAYAAALDRDTAVVFVKGLNMRPDRASDPSYFTCHFGLGNWENDRAFTFRTKAVAAAQEVVRCALPRSIRMNRSKAQGIRVTVSQVHRLPHRAPVHVRMPSVAKIIDAVSEHVALEKKHELCVCTMAWNQAPFLKEWIMYHAWLGVERWFIYDNNSDDQIKEVIEELNSENYNVSRHTWPWIKTQEAGFSHCTMRAKHSCNWVGFMDVDEFFHFPYPTPQHHGIGLPGQNSLRTLVANYTSSTIGELRTTCHSFGPSGLTSPPAQGVTAGYTCRLLRPERHKSIIRPDVLDPTLLNVVHHFRLKKGYQYLNVAQSSAVINHYKYQVWESFRAKFYRRVATYVVDWQENQNEGSRDRAPGLGTEAIEPPNWPLQFCEIWDTGLRDFVLANLADPATGLLPWERSLL